MKPAPIFRFFGLSVAEEDPGTLSVSIAAWVSDGNGSEYLDAFAERLSYDDAQQLYQALGRWLAAQGEAS